MSKKVLMSKDLEMDAMDLQSFIGEVFESDKHLVIVYIKDDEGRIFDKAQLVKETLTDRSKVYDIVLS